MEKERPPHGTACTEAREGNEAGGLYLDQELPGRNGDAKRIPVEKIPRGILPA
jgi:hypothetical protein